MRRPRVFKVVVFESFGGGYGAVVFGDDVAGALKGDGRDFVAPFCEVFYGGVAEEFDFRAMAGEDAAGFFDLGAAFGVFAAGDGVFDHGVGDDKGDGVGMGASS
jgi:hypothetical protein